MTRCQEDAGNRQRADEAICCLLKMLQGNFCLCVLHATSHSDLLNGPGLSDVPRSGLHLRKYNGRKTLIAWIAF